MDREWKPTGRPQSTMARSFSLALNDVFKIDNSLADLDAAVEQKKKAVSTQTSELEALEARLRATEERLKAREAISSPSGRSSGGANSPRQRASLGDTFTHTRPEKAETSPTSPLATEFRNKAPSRPTTAKRQEPSFTAPPIPGALPPTPGASEDGDIPPPPPPRGSESKA